MERNCADSGPKGNSERRRELMARRDVALAAGNIPEFQRLTCEIAALPLAGVGAVTAKDIARYAKVRRG